MRYCTLVDTNVCVQTVLSNRTHAPGYVVVFYKVRTRLPSFTNWYRWYTVPNVRKVDRKNNTTSGENCALVANQSVDCSATTLFTVSLNSAKVWNRGFNWPVFCVRMHRKALNVDVSNFTCGHRHWTHTAARCLTYHISDYKWYIQCYFTSGLSGFFTSPGYPDNHPNDASCTWLIQGEPEKVIVVSFFDFDLEDDASCDFDVIKLYEGIDTNRTEILQCVFDIYFYSIHPKSNVVINK